MKYTQLTEEERYSIEILIQEGYCQKEIAEWIGRNKSTISRELKRNKGSDCFYSSAMAIKMAAERRKRAIPSRFTEKAKNLIKEKLKDRVES